MTGKPIFRVLIVSGTDKVYDYITQMLPADEFSPILRAGNAGEARRILVSTSVDIIIINTPLPDDFGTNLAVDLSNGPVGVLLLVKSDIVDMVCSQTENYGVFVLGKPNTHQIIYNTLRLLAAMSVKLHKMDNKNKSLREKMADIRTVNRAKWLLIENMNMTEKDAHYYIEKQAMDTRLSRREIAENIIRTYDK